MAMVLDTKYKHNVVAFYLNRWFRIAPIYYIVFAVSILIYFAASLVAHHPVDRFELYVSAYRNSLSTLIMAVLPQFTIIGIELPLHFSYDPSYGLTLLGSSSHLQNSIPLIRFLFVPQAWSIGIELLFYAIVPFLNKFKTNQLISIAIGSFILKILIRYHFSHGTISTYDSAWLPPQLFLFILGMLSYRYMHNINEIMSINLFPYFVLIWCALYLLFSELSFCIAENSFLLLTALMLPLVFIRTKNIGWDRWVGNLSYPLYLCHIFVRWIILGRHASPSDGCSPFLLLSLSILVAILLAYFLEGPLDNWRHRTFPARSRY